MFAAHESDYLLSPVAADITKIFCSAFDKGKSKVEVPGQQKITETSCRSQRARGVFITASERWQRQNLEINKQSHFSTFPTAVE